MKRSELLPFLVGVWIAVAILASTAAFSIETVKLPDGRVVIVWTPEEMAKLENVLGELVRQRNEAQANLLRLRKQCT